MSAIDTAGFTTEELTMEELRLLFAWNPAPLRFRGTGRQHIESDTESAREAAFYNKHFAPDIACKRLVHLKDLHRSIGAVVEENMRSSYNDSLNVPPLSDIGTKIRHHDAERVEDMMKNSKSVVEYYSNTTVRYC